MSSQGTSGTDALPAPAMRVLLVEDDRELAGYLRTALMGGDEPVHLSIAERLDHAIGHATDDDLDAILLDLNLPDSRGLQTLQRLLNVAPRVPVVVLTGTADAGLAREALALGAQDWLTKGPIDAEVVQRSLRYAVERKRLNDGLLRMQKLELAGRLSSSVAHEFNNVLTGILASAQLLEQPDSDEGHQVALTLLREAIAQGTALTRQLLSLARNPPTNATVATLATLMNHAQPLVKTVLPPRIHLESGPVPDVVLRVDAGQFDQLVLNLVLNARDAMPDGGTLRIAATLETALTSLAERSSRHPTSYVAIHVSDTGAGIEPAVLPRVFEPFFSTKGEKGTGLGLAVCKEIAERFGGAIHAESTLGSGTTITVFLPAALERRSGDA
jgi:two-component system, cell cycle sensor histidine kinase and response regulator CckA